MKRLILSLVCVLTVASVAQADHRRARHRAQRATTRTVHVTKQAAAAPAKVVVQVASVPVKAVRGFGCTAKGCSR